MLPSLALLTMRLRRCSHVARCQPSNTLFLAVLHISVLLLCILTLLPIVARSDTSQLPAAEHQTSGSVDAQSQPSNLSVDLTAPLRPHGRVAGMPLALENELIIIHNHSLISEYSVRREGPRLGPDGKLFCRFWLPNGSYIATPAVRAARQNLHCEHPPADVRSSVIGQPVTLAFIQPHKPDRVTIPTFVRYTYDPIRPDPWQPRPVGMSPKPHFLCACLTLWYRADFLYEWLLYHQQLHNLTKLFLYDNNSEIDDLRGVHTWMSMLFNIEYIHLPLFMSQYGAISHCMLRSMTECEWTLMVDVDEFFYIAENKGSTFPKLASTLSISKGAVSGLMYNTRAETILDDMPEGGALRNFQCLIGLGNTKFVLRAGSGMQNLSHGVHFAMLQRGQKSHLGWGNFVHMQYLSRSVFARKMMRRVSPGGEAAYFRWTDPEAAMNKLFDSKHDNATFPCKSLEPKPYNALLCHISRKLPVRRVGIAAACASEKHLQDVILVGLPGRNSGLGRVALPDNSPVGKAYDMGAPGPSEPRYHRYVHVVESPLTGIAAMMQVRNNDTNKFTPANGVSHQLLMQDAALEWVRRHRYFELFADVRQRIEDLSDCTQLCTGGAHVGELGMDDATLAMCPRVLAGCQLQREDSITGMPRLTWGQLLAINTHLTAEIATMGRMYGYEIPLLPAVAVDEPEMLPEEEFPGDVKVARAFLNVFGNVTAKYVPALHTLRQQLGAVAAEIEVWNNASEIASKNPLAFIAAEAVAVLPLHSASSEVLNGIVVRAAARRRLRIHIPPDAQYSYKRLATVPELNLRSSMAVAPPPVGAGSIDGVAGARQFFEHAIGTSVRLLTVWDDPVQFYLSCIFHHLEAHEEPTTATNIDRMVQSGKGANPLANSLNLNSDAEVKTFIDADFPGLDLVLLSSRWNESLAVLRRTFNWTTVDVVDARAISLQSNPYLPYVVAANGTLLTTIIEEMSPLNYEQTSAIKALTRLDQMLYDAAQERFNKLLQTLTEDTERPSIANEIEHLHRLSASLGKVCEGYAQLTACVYWQLPTAAMASLMTPTGRVPALDFNGQPVFTYMRRATQLVSAS